MIAAALLAALTWWTAHMTPAPAVTPEPVTHCTSCDPTSTPTPTSASVGPATDVPLCGPWLPAGDTCWRDAPDDPVEVAEGN